MTQKMLSLFQKVLSPMTGFMEQAWSKPGRTERVGTEEDLG